MADTKSKWDEIRAVLNKAFTKGDEEPGQAGGGDPPENVYDEGDYADASAILKSLNDNVEALQDTIITMAKAQTLILDKLEKQDVMQKSIGQGILALVEHANETPNPRKGAVTQLEAQMAKALGGGGFEAGGDGGGAKPRLKPFTREGIDKMKPILIKAVSDGEIDMITSGMYETQMNKSVGKAAFPFTPDFVSFVLRKSAASA